VFVLHFELSFARTTPRDAQLIQRAIPSTPHAELPIS
jgi:hypothetical protein